jgi:acyl-CoA reductase-like NAD-dependent aldehyde dehydrogenase
MKGEDHTMEQPGLTQYVAGVRLAPTADDPRITSLDGSIELAIAETHAVELRRALRHADDCQAMLDETPLSARIEVARLLVAEYARRVDETCWALANFRGITASDTRWMCRVNLEWAANFEALTEVLWGEHVDSAPAVTGPTAALRWRSRGTAALFSSSTMDGPPAVVALCHAILSGTHFILKPSFRDAVTHMALDALYDHGLQHYAQLVRWRSDAPHAAQLNRQLLNQASQAVVFSSNEAYRALLDTAAAPASEEHEALRLRVKRYGTGLPVAIVTNEADLEQAARDLVEGARLGGGRFCLSACPVLVDRRVHDALVARIVAHAEPLRAGPVLAESTELSAHDPADTASLRAVLRSFGGTPVFGEVRDQDMDVVVLADVPVGTPALHRELPGTALAVIPVEGLEHALTVAAGALRQNHREAWTAVVLFGDAQQFATLHRALPAYRYLRGGVVSRVKLLLPHQGAYFALDLMRRVTLE